MFKKLYHFMLPYRCIICSSPGTRSQDLCEHCYESLPLLDHACLCCAMPLRASSLCGQCLQHPPFFDRVYALYLYETPIVQLIRALKFKQNLLYARLLGELLAEKLATNWYLDKPLPEIIIPIPLHAQRLKERGFNQALEIARPVAHRLNLLINLEIGKRIKFTAAQTLLPIQDRKKNTQDAFKLAGKLYEKHIAVIDDVITTGNTVNEFCRLLREAGAEQIDVWCCARAGKSG